MSEVTLEKITDIISTSSWNDPNSRKLSRVLSTLEESGLMEPFKTEEHIFYPKNFFKKDTEMEFYFISKELITVFTYEYDEQEQSSINVKYIPISDPIVELKHYSLYGPNVVCTLTLQNGLILSFASSDTNEHWTRTFRNQVIDIFKLFTTSN